MKGLTFKISQSDDGFSVVAYHPDSNRYDKSVGHMIVECWSNMTRDTFYCAVAEAEVVAEWRRRGIGAKLYKRAAAEAKKYDSTLCSGKHTSVQASMLWWHLVKRGVAEHVGGRNPFCFKP